MEMMMPAVVYDNKFTGERIGPVKMPTPKRITDSVAWLREARKVIPQIPQTIELRGEDWLIDGDWITSTKIVLIPLRNRDGEKANVAIDRSVPMI